MTASQETGLMRDMHVMSTVWGLGGRLVAGCDGLPPDIQPFTILPAFFSRDPYRTLQMRGGREGEIIERTC